MKKRFIAGAVCPKCQAQDTIRVYQDDQVQERECVACGFEDRISAQTGLALPKTRADKSIERVSKEAAEKEVQFKEVQILKLK